MLSSAFSGLKPAHPFAEAAMLVAETLLDTDCQRVEVSGWDEAQTFFVEKSDLAWDDFAGKHLSLRHMLPDGAMVFVRMLQPNGLRQFPPSVYHVEFIGCDPEGLRQFRLNPVHPRYNQEPESVN
jgi:hypothetical protein